MQSHPQARSTSWWALTSTAPCIRPPRLGYYRHAQETPLKPAEEEHDTHIPTTISCPSIATTLRHKQPVDHIAAMRTLKNGEYQYVYATNGTPH
eukprot:3373659-Pyramimonas_sp.AAC.1